MTCWQCMGDVCNGEGEYGDDDDDLPFADAPDYSESVCRICGCTDDDCSQCVERTGRSCIWVAGDLCSACWPFQRAEVRR